MQAQNPNAIIGDIDAHIQKSGVTNPNWYVGVTSDIEARLFGDRRVPRENYCWICRRATSSDQARAVEDAYRRAGCKGSGGGGDDTAFYVYAYVITSQTAE